jgi:hypothetical protein
MIQIQNASASDADRDDKRLKGKGWNTIAYGIDYKTACMELILAINDGNVNTEDGWLRIFNSSTKEVINL